VDIWTADKRSQVMAQVRSRGNLSTEEALAHLGPWVGELRVVEIVAA
jgi:hypothetical protein